MCNRDRRFLDSRQLEGAGKALYICYSSIVVMNMELKHLTFRQEGAYIKGEEDMGLVRVRPVDYPRVVFLNETRCDDCGLEPTFLEHEYVRNSASVSSADAYTRGNPIRHNLEIVIPFQLYQILNDEREEEQPAPLDLTD